MRRFKIGDHVVYRKPKISTRPGQRAKHIYPAKRGDNYYYDVEKYWTVSDVTDDKKIIVKTRRGKVHEISAGDPLLRKANLMDEVLNRSRFPDSETA